MEITISNISEITVTGEKFSNPKNSLNLLDQDFELFLPKSSF